LLGLNPIKQLTPVQVRQHQMNVLIGFIHFIELDDIRMMKFSQDVDFLQNAHDVSLAFLNLALLNCFQSERLTAWIILSSARVNFCEIASSQEWPKFEFFFEIQEDSSCLESLDPLVDEVLVLVVELQALTLGHENETEKLRAVILQMSFLEPGVLAVEYPSLHLVLVGAELNQLMPDQHHVFLLEVWLIIVLWLRGLDADVLNIVIKLIQDNRLLIQIGLLFRSD
jgi:hypothetical protein